MPRFCRSLICGLLLLLPGGAFGRSKTGLIDVYCQTLRSEFAGAVPFVFSGPDPWVKLDDVPASMPNEALAFIYTAGPDIRWVFLRITDENNAWFEDIEYYYRDDGSLAKRVRHLQSLASNIALDVSSYYAGGRLIKQKSHHYPLAHGKTDNSQFSDPNAPTFWSVDDLPFPAIDDLWKRHA